MQRDRQTRDATRPRTVVRRALAFAALACVGGFLASCTSTREDPEDIKPAVVDEEGAIRQNGWTTESHSNATDPNFAEVFDASQVKRLDLVIGETQWGVMVDDMTALYGAPGTSVGGPGGPGAGLLENADPIYVPASVLYEGQEWTSVGIRFKGNSSLQSTWSSGNLKLSFKMNFDKFEDDVPAIKNQRFFGFKKLSLKNNFDDPSLLREKLMADVFADSGLAMSHTAFYEVYVDRGDGPEYFGVYTLVEEVDDTVIKTQFDDDSGNLYKPDGDAATFAADTAGAVLEDVFIKKTNEDAADFSDIEALYAALHDPVRLTDPATWRAQLEAVFETDVFLRYLAINTVAQNWDTYGRMTHNYFLYASPTTGALTWIPWDNNEALQAGKRGGSLSLDFGDLDTEAWPLIGFLIADPVYRAQYSEFVGAFVTGVFSPAAMEPKIAAYAALVAPYAAAERPGFTFLRSPSAFTAAITTLQGHCATRASLGAVFAGSD